MKRGTGEVIYILILIFFDTLMLNLAWIVSYWLRFFSGIFETPLGIPPFSLYFRIIFFLTPFAIIVFLILGMYKKTLQSLSDIFESVIKATLFILFIFLLVTFFDRETSYSRGFTFLFLGVVISFLFFARLLLLFLFLYLKKKKYGITNFAIVGLDQNVEYVIKEMNEKKVLDYNFVGIIADTDTKNYPALGNVENIENIIKQYKIDEIFISNKSFTSSKIMEIVTKVDNCNIKINLIPELLDMMTNCVNFKIFKGIPIITIKEIPLQVWNLLIKRIMDIIISFILLILLLPVILIISILIKMTSLGHIIYKQERIGRDGKKFILYKFRTMILEAEKETGPVWVQKDDKRITKIGKILRRFSFDEIPQLLNVLKGDMSLVGPRPERIYFIEQFKQNIPRYLERHKVKSGITGWAQVNGLRGNTSLEERIKYDLFYIENWSLLLDLKILLKTFFVIFTQKNIY